MKTATAQAVSADLNERVRQKLWELRKQKLRMTQEEFCKELNWEVYIVTDLERGHTCWNLNRIEQVCNRFGVKIEKLFKD